MRTRLLTLRSARNATRHLFVAVFVDFCLLLVCINRPINRLHTALQGEEQDRPAVQLLAKFNQTHLGDLQEGLQVFQQAAKPLLS